MWVIADTWPVSTFTLPYKGVFVSLIFLTGGIVCGLGVLSFLRARTTLNPLQPSRATALVFVGIYRYSRNPMYLGFLLGLVAWGVYLSHALALVLGPALFVTYMTRFQIVPEECALEASFGERYRDYKKKVRRWL